MDFLCNRLAALLKAHPTLAHHIEQRHWIRLFKFINRYNICHATWPLYLLWKNSLLSTDAAVNTAQLQSPRLICTNDITAIVRCLTHLPKEWHGGGEVARRELEWMKSLQATSRSTSNSANSASNAAVATSSSSSPSTSGSPIQFDEINQVCDHLILKTLIMEYESETKPSANLGKAKKNKAKKALAPTSLETIDNFFQSIPNKTQLAHRTMTEFRSSLGLNDHAKEDQAAKETLATQPSTAAPPPTSASAIESASTFAASREFMDRLRELLKQLRALPDNTDLEPILAKLSQEWSTIHSNPSVYLRNGAFLFQYLCLLDALKHLPSKDRINLVTGVIDQCLALEQSLISKSPPTHAHSLPPYIVNSRCWTLLFHTIVTSPVPTEYESLFLKYWNLASQRASDVERRWNAIRALAKSSNASLHPPAALLAEWSKLQSNHRLTGEMYEKYVLLYANSGPAQSQALHDLWRTIPFKMKKESPTMFADMLKACAKDGWLNLQPSSSSASNASSVTPPDSLDYRRQFISSIIADYDTCQHPWVTSNPPFSLIAMAAYQPTADVAEAMRLWENWRDVKKLALTSPMYTSILQVMLRASWEDLAQYGEILKLIDEMQQNEIEFTPDDIDRLVRTSHSVFKQAINSLEGSSQDMSANRSTLTRLGEQVIDWAEIGEGVELKPSTLDLIRYAERRLYQIQLESARHDLVSDRPMSTQDGSRIDPKTGTGFIWRLRHLFGKSKQGTDGNQPV